MKEIFLPPSVQIRLAERLGRTPREAREDIADAISALWLERNEAPESLIDEIDYKLETLALNAEGPLREEHNLDGEGDREHEVYRVPSRSEVDFWVSVTDIPCPVPGCDNTVVWYEAGFVPGYRVCMTRTGENSFNEDTIEHRFMATGKALDPKLILIG